MNRENEFYLK